MTCDETREKSYEMWKCPTQTISSTVFGNLTSRAGELEARPTGRGMIHCWRMLGCRDRLRARIKALTLGAGVPWGVCPVAGLESEVFSTWHMRMHMCMCKKKERKDTTQGQATSSFPREG